jgi:hypothetical protein
MSLRDLSKAIFGTRQEDPLIIYVDEAEAASAPIPHARVEAILECVKASGYAAPEGQTCSCGAAIAEGSPHWYRSEFFCSEACNRAAVEKQQQLSAHFFGELQEAGL